MKRTLSLLLTLFCCTLLSAQVVLVKGGKAKGRIVRAHGDAQTEAAATLLQDFIERVSGVELPIIREADKLRKDDVVIGGAASHDVEDGFEITERDGRLYVDTGGGSGAINGVVWLLEHELGVHYYAKDYYTTPLSPRAGGMVTSSAKVSSDIVLTVPPVQGAPAFRYRQTHSYGNDDPIYRQWFALEGPQDEFIDNMWVHTFNRILPARRFGKAHPEWYSLLNGERRPGDHSQWCLSNPEVLEACAQQLDSIFKANPTMSMISVSQNDGNDTYCHCPECMRIYEEEGAVSGAYIRFMNELARRFPDKQISTLAYLFTCQPPKKVKPLPNVNIMLCDIDCKREVPLTDNASGQWFVSAMEGWSAISNNIFVWDYGINFDNQVSPFPNFHILQKNIQLFHRNHTTMHFAQVNGARGTDFAELRAYMLAKLMWDPYCDADSLQQTFMRGYYGDAAPYLSEYLKLLEGGLLASHKDLWIYDSPITHKDGMLCPQLLKTYDELFDRAEAAVAHDSVLLEHVRVSRLPLQYSKLEIARTMPTPLSPRAGGTDTNGKASIGVVTSPPARGAGGVDADLALFEQRTRDFGVKSLNERNNSPAEYCALYRKRFLPQSVPSKALGAKVFYLDVPGTTTPGSVKVTPLGAPDPKYKPIAETALTDGLYGGTTYVESWVGWCGRDADFVIDLLEEKTFTRIETDFLHQLGAWILLPKGGTYEIASDDDGRAAVELSDYAKMPWKPFGSFAFPEDRDGQVKFVPGAAEVQQPVTARFIKVHVNTLGLCPDWHYGVGYPAWFFMDEVNVY